MFTNYQKFPGKICHWLDYLQKVNDLKRIFSILIYNFITTT